MLCLYIVVIASLETPEEQERGQAKSCSIERRFAFREFLTKGRAKQTRRASRSPRTEVHEPRTDQPAPDGVEVGLPSPPYEGVKETSRHSHADGQVTQRG